MKETFLAPHLGPARRHPQPWRTLILNAGKVDDNTAAEGGGDIADDTGGMGVGSNILVVDFSQVERQHRQRPPGSWCWRYRQRRHRGHQGEHCRRQYRFRRRRWRHPYHGVMIIRLTRMTGETAPADSSGDQGMGSGIANISVAPSPPAGLLTIVFSKVSRNTASGRPRSDLEVTITKKARA